MTALLVERAGRTRGDAAGNIGPTLLDTLAARSTPRQRPSRCPRSGCWSCRASSWTACRGFEPDAATVLNITPGPPGLARQMDAYAAAKARIFGRRALMVVNRDDPRVRRWCRSRRRPLRRASPRRRSSSRARAALRPGRAAAPGRLRLVVENGMAWLVRALPPTKRASSAQGREPEIHLQRLMPADALRVRGRHNAANALAALALAGGHRLPLAPMLHALRDYRGEPHRVEPVGSVGGVEAFDDSKGTNVGATVAALLGLGADKAPARLVVILGGDGKGQDFTPLAAPVARTRAPWPLIGRDARPSKAVLRRCRRADAAPRHAARGHRLVLRAGAGRATRCC
jgi:UDP-N-acetylmuramoylalanine--D-glutamate ligase